MAMKPRPETAPPRCVHCGAALHGSAGAEAVPTGECERCYLDQHPARPSLPWPIEAAFAEALVEALDLREHETGLHSRRVACHTRVLAQRISTDPEFLHQIYWGALLHDLGKIGVPDDVLLKAGALDPQEWALMRQHPETGSRIVRRLPGMDIAADIVLCHEERFDGTGYPRGLKGDAIPIGARLFAIIDTLDAITSDRPYRSGQSFEHATAEIIRGAGTQFDPLAVDTMLAEEATLRRMVATKCIQGLPEDAPPVRP